MTTNSGAVEYVPVPDVIPDPIPGTVNENVNTEIVSIVCDLSPINLIKFLHYMYKLNNIYIFNIVDIVISLSWKKYVNSIS
jgi:hypothetical protein